MLKKFPTFGNNADLKKLVVSVEELTKDLVLGFLKPFLDDSKVQPM